MYPLRRQLGGVAGVVWLMLERNDDKGWVGVFITLEPIYNLTSHLCLMITRTWTNGSDIIGEEGKLDKMFHNDDQYGIHISMTTTYNQSQ